MLACIEADTSDRETASVVVLRAALDNGGIDGLAIHGEHHLHRRKRCAGYFVLILAFLGRLWAGSQACAHFGGEIALVLAAEVSNSSAEVILGFDGELERSGERAAHRVVHVR